MSATRFDTNSEVEEFFAERGIEIGSIWILGDSIGVELRSEEDAKKAETFGLEYYPGDRPPGSVYGIVFYPTKP